MANEIKLVGISGKTYYAIIMKANGTDTWNGTSLVAFSEAGWSSYAIALSQLGANITLWTANVPSSLPVGNYRVLFYEQVGGSPSVANDVCVDGQVTEWSGTQLYQPDYESMNMVKDGKVASGASTTQFTGSTDFEATADAYLGQFVVFLSGTNKGQARQITNYTAGRVFTVSPALGAIPATDDKIRVIGRA